MSFLNEVVKQENIGISFQSAIAFKQREQEELDQQKREFFSSGGSVHVLQGCGQKAKKQYEQAVFDKKREEAEKTISFKPVKYVRIFKDGRKPQVKILKKHLGTYETIRDAKIARNQFLIEFGMQPIDDLDE